MGSNNARRRPVGVALRLGRPCDASPCPQPPGHFTLSPSLRVAAPRVATCLPAGGVLR